MSTLTALRQHLLAAALACTALGPSLVAAQGTAPATDTAATSTPTSSAPPTAAQPGQPPKILRYAFRVAETGFDPAQVNDLYSRTVTPHIFEGLYTYDQLARPYKIKPLTADGMPVVSADFKTWTVKIQPGIFFADDPAFQGKKRELVAADYVYAFKRYADPKLKSPNWSYLEQYGLLGLRELRKTALDSKQPLDYDKPIEGLKALDRYTVQFKHGQPAPAFHRHAGHGRLVRCRGPRSGRGLRRPNRRAPRGHRSLPLEAVAPQLADRAGAQPHLPRQIL